MAPFSKKKTPQEVIEKLEVLLQSALKLQYGATATQQEKEEKIRVHAGLEKYLLPTKLMLCGESISGLDYVEQHHTIDTSAIVNSCLKLGIPILFAQAVPILLHNQVKIAIVCFTKIVRYVWTSSDTGEAVQIGSEWILQNVKSTTPFEDSVLGILLGGYSSSKHALTYGLMLRECLKGKKVAQYFLEQSLYQHLIDKFDDHHFEITQDAFAIFKELFTRNIEMVDDYFEHNMMSFFEQYSRALQTESFVTRFQVIQLLCKLFEDTNRKHNRTMFKIFVSRVDNLKYAMNNMKDKKHKQVRNEAFHLFTLFLVQPMTHEVKATLLNNQERLLEFLYKFEQERDSNDMEFREQIKQVRCSVQQLENAVAEQGPDTTYTAHSATVRSSMSQTVASDFTEGRASMTMSNTSNGAMGVGRGEKGSVGQGVGGEEDVGGVEGVGAQQDAGGVAESGDVDVGVGGQVEDAHVLQQTE